MSDFGPLIWSLSGWNLVLNTTQALTHQPTLVQTTQNIIWHTSTWNFSTCLLLLFRSPSPCASFHPLMIARSRCIVWPRSQHPDNRETAMYKWLVTQVDPDRATIQPCPGLSHWESVAVSAGIFFLTFFTTKQKDKNTKWQKDKMATN